MPEPIVFLVALLATSCTACLLIIGCVLVREYNLLRNTPRVGDELGALEEQLEPAFQFPPKWKDSGHVELPKRDRIGLRGPEIEHRSERVVSSRRAA